MRSRIGLIATILAGGLLVAACSGTAATPTAAPITAAPPSPTPAILGPTVGPGPTAPAMTDGQGPEHFSGLTTTQPSLTTPYTQTKVGDVTQYRGGVATWTFTTTDPRMGGTATWRFSVDGYGSVGPQWGPLEVKNANGSWAGNCTAGSWNAGSYIAFGCWLAGAGAYSGFTAYYSLVQTSTYDWQVEGILYPGSAPTP